jgi:MT0933-like antitoxin protein
MGFLDKVKDLVSKNTDKVDAAIEKVGDVVDQKTQGKYAQQIDKAQEAAKKAVDGTQQPPATEPQSPPAPPAPPAAPPTS